MGDKGARETLYVRMTEDLKKSVKAVLSGEGRNRGPITMNDLITGVLEYYLDLSLEQQEQVIRGYGPDPQDVGVRKSSDLIRRVAWADHALFNKRRWFWACEEYMGLSRASSEAKAHGTLELAQYKLGYCWLTICGLLHEEAIRYRDSWIANQCLNFVKDHARATLGIDLDYGEDTRAGLLSLVAECEARNQAPDPARAFVFGSTEDVANFNALLDAADGAAGYGIAFNDGYENLVNEWPGGRLVDEHRPIVLYNSACAWAMRAAIGMLRVVGRSPVRAGDAIAQVRAATMLGADAPSWAGWQWQPWRQAEGGREAEAAVAECAREAFRFLERALPGEDGNLWRDAGSPSDTSFLRVSAGSDPDLFFVRNDLKFRNRFQDLLQEGGKADWELMLDAYGRLCGNAAALVGPGDGVGLPDDAR